MATKITIEVTDRIAAQLDCAAHAWNKLKKNSGKPNRSATVLQIVVEALRGSPFSGRPKVKR